MDKIWYRNPSKSELIGRCGGDEKTEEPTKVNAKQKNNGLQPHPCYSRIFRVNRL